MPAVPLDPTDAPAGFYAVRKADVPHDQGNRIETAIAEGREVPEPPTFQRESPEAIAALMRQARAYLRAKQRPE